jgi:uncharacterized membrane protein YphA (DoxX/SURF4 family)
MKTTATIARILLGLIFFVFGLNGFLHFIPMKPPAGTAGQFMGILFVSHYYVTVFLLQAVAGLLLLVNRFVPIALVLLGPLLVNIVLFHAHMAPEGLPVAAVALVLWIIVFASVRRAFSGVFVARA